MTASAVTDLPQPDSPTRQWVSPRFTVRDTPRTAAMLVPKVTRRFVVSRTGVICPRFSPSPCGRGLGGGGRGVLAAPPPPNPLPHGEGESVPSILLASDSISSRPPRTQ